MNIDDKHDEQQRWIDDLLRAGANELSQLPPDTLRESVRSAVTRERRRAELTVCSLAAAACLAIVTGWTVLHAPQHPATIDAMDQRMAALTTPSKSRPISTSQVTTKQATFVSNSDAIAIPLESSSPDVTIVQLYPTTDTEQRWRRELIVSSISGESNGG
jgi:hypothetical protein